IKLEKGRADKGQHNDPTNNGEYEEHIHTRLWSHRSWLMYHIIHVCIERFHKQPFYIIRHCHLRCLCSTQFCNVIDVASQILLASLQPAINLPQGNRQHTTYRHYYSPRLPLTQLPFF